MLKKLGAKNKKYTSLLVVPSLYVISTPLVAQEPNTVSTGRYTEVSNQVSYAQNYPLSVIVDTTLPQSVGTVKDALQFLLARSGYSLIETSAAPEPTQILFSHPVPSVQRTIKHVSLKNALKMLAGDKFNLIIDPVYRRVSFELDQSVKVLYEREN